MIDTRAVERPPARDPPATTITSSPPTSAGCAGAAAPAPSSSSRTRSAASAGSRRAGPGPLVALDVRERPELARKYGIAVLPTVFAVAANGTVLERLAP